MKQKYPIGAADSGCQVSLGRSSSISQNHIGGITMVAKYKFVCRTCKFECISAIGSDVGPYYSTVVMACGSCADIGSFVLANPNSINTELSRTPVCKGCHSSKHLVVWDGLTCPHCKMSMRAIGPDVEAERPYRYYR